LFVYRIARLGAWHAHRADRLSRVLRVLLGGCLALALAGSVTARADAGLPEWGACRATAGGTGGRFKDAKCLAKAGRRDGVPQGAYEWSGLAAGAQVRLMPMTLEGSLRFQTPAGMLIECRSLAAESFARVRGPNGTATPLWELGSCSSEGSSCETGSAAISLGEISNLFAWQEEPADAGGPVPAWVGRLGFVSKKTDPRTVGVLYTVANHERLFAPVSCDGLLGTVWIGGEARSRNSFVSTIGPVDTMSGEFTEVFAEEAPGVQAPGGLEHHAPARLLAFLENRWEPVAITAVFHYKVEAGSGQLEIKASP
jgi:hypothetical protein